MPDTDVLEIEPLEGAEETTPDEQPIPAGEEKLPAEGEEQTAPVTSLLGPDGKKLDPTVRSLLSEIRTKNDAAGKLLTKAVYRVAELDREFPGGLTEARELRDKIEGLGGVEGIEGKLETLAELTGLSKQFMDGDPAFVEDMATSSPEAFAALAPAVFAKYAQTNPDGFTAYIGRVVWSDMNTNGIPLLLQRMADFMPADKPQALELLNSLSAYLNGFGELSKKAPATARPKAEAKPDADLTAREEALRSREWKTERDGIQRGIVRDEEVKALSGRRPDTEERAQIRELFMTRSQAAANRLFPGWGEKAHRFIKSGDKAGYLRYMKSIYTRVVPEAMASAVSSTMRHSKAAPVTTKTAVARPGATVAPANGFKPVTSIPQNIDWSRTSKQMVQEDRYILTDGSRVQVR
jgi:hypothetical protein